MRAALLLVASSLIFACSGAPRYAVGATTEQNLGTSASIPELPSPSGTGALTPWGGTDPSRWRPEAIVANAASNALNDARKQSNIVDAVVAIPTKMLSSQLFEYGDGQANAAPSFPWWNQPRPQIVATLVRTAGAPPRVTFRFDRALPYSGTTFEIQYAKNGQGPLTSVTLNATRTSDGDAIATWEPTSDLGWDGSSSRRRRSAPRSS